MSVTVVILTLNEMRHIERAIHSVRPFAERIFVVDSGSTDGTVARARALGAKVVSHPFVNHAQQFNWALLQLPQDTEWVFRLDADEIVSPELGREIRARLPDVAPVVAGLTMPRRIVFLGREIQHGGVFPVHVTRLFRFGRGRSENSWMDEHIVVDGQVAPLKGELIDDNRNPLGWWIDKHNGYASREALQILLSERASRSGPDGPGTRDHVKRPAARANLGRASRWRRWLKTAVYARFPVSSRAFAYFGYRYVLRGGFRDGYAGLAFHVLQGFWYRFLVDAKLHEMRARLGRSDGEGDFQQAGRDILGIDPYA